MIPVEAYVGSSQKFKLIIELFIFAFLITKIKNSAEGVTCHSHQQCRKKGVYEGGGAILIRSEIHKSGNKIKAGKNSKLGKSHKCYVLGFKVIFEIYSLFLYCDHSKSFLPIR